MLTDFCECSKCPAYRKISLERLKQSRVCRANSINKYNYVGFDEHPNVQHVQQNRLLAHQAIRKRQDNSQLLYDGELILEVREDQHTSSV